MFTGALVRWGNNRLSASVATAHASEPSLQTLQAMRASVRPPLPLFESMRGAWQHRELPHVLLVSFLLPVHDAPYPASGQPRRGRSGGGNLPPSVSAVIGCVPFALVESSIPRKRTETRARWTGGPGKAAMRAVACSAWPAGCGLPCAGRFGAACGVLTTWPGSASPWRERGAVVTGGAVR